MSTQNGYLISPFSDIFLFQISSFFNGSFDARRLVCLHLAAPIFYKYSFPASSTHNIIFGWIFEIAPESAENHAHRRHNL